MTALTDASVVPAPPADTSGRSGRLQHLPALDGLRGLAVVAVLFFHGGFGWAKGGWLGVSVFFTLSGFLITNLLVAEWASDGSISLKTFWSRRFRRLMPAAIACLLLVALYGAVYASPEQLQNLRADLLAALGYVANWRFLLADVSYADLFSAPSPVQHFWSLAIEEQFYVLYPLVVFGALRLGGRRLLAGLLTVAVAASLVVAYVARGDLDRVYYGTDTRMAELLAGGLLALWWSGSQSRREAGRGGVRSSAIVLLGLAGLAGSLVLWPSVGQADRFVTHGVLPIQAVLSVAMIAAGARPGIVSDLLAIRPLTALGLVSYGLYLYHWPVFLVLDEERTDLSLWPLFFLRIAVTGALAVASYLLLEQPIRRKRVLLRPLAVAGAVVIGVSAVVASSVAVTLDPPVTEIAHAGVDLEDQEITVDTTPGTSSGPAASGAPETVLIIGDSGTYDAAPAIGAHFQSLGTRAVIDASFPGFGLTRDPDGWKSSWPQVVAEHDPRLVVVMLGGWDAQFTEDEGEQAYIDLVGDAVDLLTVNGARILWLSMLPGPDTETETMDAVFERFPKVFPDKIAYGDIGEALQDEDGSYPRWLPADDGDLELVRKPDGWHLCPDGAIRVARVVGRLAASLGLAPEPVRGWEDGDWRANPRYDDPKGGCDVERAENAPPTEGR